MKKTMKRRHKIYIALVASFLLPVLFQNCSKGFEAQDLTEFSSTGSLFNSDSKGNPFACTDPNQMSSSPLMRLTQTQYANTLSNALGATLYAQLKDSVATLYGDNLTKSVLDFRRQIDDTQMSAYQSVAEKAYGLINTSATAATLAGSCLNTSPLPANCKSDFIKSIGLKFFRRPLRDTEVVKFSSQVFDTGASPAEGVALTVYAMMISPDFLLRLELGNPSDTSTASVIALSAYEVASRLSYLLWDSPPDAALFQAASQGQLSTPQQLSAQVDRMLTDTRAKAKIRDFFRFWLDPKKFAAASFSPGFINGLDVAGVNTELEREMYEYIDYVVFQKKGTFQDLLAGTESFARTPAAAEIYGHAAVTGATPATLAPVRKGLLMRAPVIATEGNETHPILRGVKFKRRFLCDTLGLPSGVMTNDPTFFSDAARMRDSTRTRTAGLTGSSTCMACHGIINPFGFAFENFDGLGRVRTIEQSYSTQGTPLAQFPIDTRVSGLMVEPGTSYGVNDGREVIDHMLEGNKVPACFVQQIYRYYQVRAEQPQDSCQLSSMYERVKSGDYKNKPILSAFKELLVYPTLLKRKL